MLMQLRDPMHSNDPIPGRHVLVTGGAGYLGSVLVPLLLEAGYEVSVIDIFAFGKESLAGVASHPDLHLYEENITHVDRLSKLFDDIDAVVHLASVSNDPSCDLDPNLSIRTNYLATTTLARLARAKGINQFLFASSCSVYGIGSCRILDELSVPGPVTLYALTKLANEREILELSSQDFRVTVLRLATLFGLSPRMRFDLAVNFMTKRALQGEEIGVNGAGLQYRPFIHVQDAADAILKVLQANPNLVLGQVFNVGGDRLNFTINGLAKEIQKAFPEVRIEHQGGNNDSRSYRVRFQKFRETLGFTPRREILDAVKEISLAYQEGFLGSMDEEKYYNVSVMKRLHGKTADSPWQKVSSPAVRTSSSRANHANHSPRQH